MSCVDSRTSIDSVIPTLNIVAWSAVAPWAEPRQIEQDLALSRAIVELFADPFLRQALRFRGGTALNKLCFPVPIRYSEDIDLVRTSAGAIGPILDHARAALEPWLGPAAFDRNPTTARLGFRAPAEDDPEAHLRIKIEINTAEIDTCDAPVSIPFEVANPWFSGTADVSTFSREELLATKLRALLQRDKGRDLFDLAHALRTFEDLDVSRVVRCLRFHLDRSVLVIRRAEAEQRMFAKLRRPTFMRDVRPLLSVAEAQRLTDETIRTAFASVFNTLIARLPGESWARTAEMTERFGIPCDPGTEIPS